MSTNFHKRGFGQGSLPQWLVYLAFFVSGVAALIYEISWSRQIGLLFGHTVHAAAIVLAGYFAGMAIGYLIGARWSARISPLIGYAVAELVVAGWAIAIPMLIALSESSTIAPWLSSSSFFWQTMLRAFFSFLLLLPATVALGATLPMMAAFFSSRGDGGLADSANASRVTLAYAVNTAGAFVGVLLATFHMLVIVGVQTSSFVAAAMSVVSALFAIVVWKIGGTGKRHNGNLVDANPGSSRPLGAGMIALSALSGFGILALQVLYTRMFSLVFHNSTYTFGVVVAVFLASLAMGAAVASVLQRRYDAHHVIGVTTGCGALATSSSVLVFVWLTDLKYFSCGDSFFQYILGAILLVTVVVAPAITCLGTMLPLVWAMAGNNRSAGQVVGRLTAGNTLAAAVGAVTASFVLLIWIDLWQSIVLIATLFFVAAFFLLWQRKQSPLASVMAVLAGMISVLAVGSPTESQVDRNKYDEQIVQRWNSPYGWIDVVKTETTGAFKIRQNLHYRFGKTGENRREYRQAHIPLLLHNDPQDVLFMGLGTGLTAGGAIPHPEVKSIVAVELIPEVVQAVRSLSQYNYNFVDDPKVEIHIDDARHYLLATDRKYDVMISDLFVPWESESGYLYTVEHYEIAFQRLKAGGLFCQWLPLYQLGEPEFESIANSFAKVFPNTTLWWVQLDSTGPIVALVGTREQIVGDANQLTSRLNQLNQNLISPDPSVSTPELLWGHYLGDWGTQSPSGFNTDEHPRVEFYAPISHRDGKMIVGDNFKRYFESLLSHLSTQGARLSDDQIENASRRRARQKLILFGK